jgi:hypothetical protein
MSFKTFKQFLTENSDTGNYVSVESEDLSMVFHNYGFDDPITGQTPPEGDYHCTLMYSESTRMNPESILPALVRSFPIGILARVQCFECFDSLPEEGKRDESKSCIVMKLKSHELTIVHSYLQNIGLRHSYPSFQPHVTLRYNMSVEEAHYYRDKFNAGMKSQTIKLSNFKSARINKNYV